MNITKLNVVRNIYNHVFFVKFCYSFFFYFSSSFFLSSFSFPFIAFILSSFPLSPSSSSFSFFHCFCFPFSSLFLLQLHLFLFSPFFFFPHFSSSFSFFLNDVILNYYHHYVHYRFVFCYALCILSNGKFKLNLHIMKEIRYRFVYEN